MNKYLSAIIDNCVLYNLHRNRSKEQQFFCSFNEPPKVKLGEFYQDPSLPQIDFNVESEINNYVRGFYSYNSEIQDNDVSNGLATGLFYENKAKESDLNAVLVHGWRSDNLRDINNMFLNRFLDLGYNIYTVTLPYHMERNSKKALYNGELMLSANVDRSLLSIKQAVTDISALLKWIKKNKSGKIALIGISLGGLISNLTCVADKNIDILISAFYANCMAHSVWYTLTGKYIKKDFEKGGYSFEELKKAWDIITPSSFKPIIPKENILLFSGKYDRFVRIDDTDSLWEGWSKPKRIVYKCGHSGIVFFKDEVYKESIKFINQKIQSGVKK